MAATTGFTMIKEKLPATAFATNINIIKKSANRSTKEKGTRLFTGVMPAKHQADCKNKSF